MADLQDTMKSTSQGLTDISNKVKSLDAEWGQVGASSSAALGVMSAALSKTNPILAQGLGSLQKMVPILQQIATAAKTSGTALKTAFASSGIGLLVIAITEAITLISRLATESHNAGQAAREEADEFFDDLKKKNEEYRRSQLSEDQKYEEDRTKALQELRTKELEWNETLSKYGENDRKGRTRAAKQAFKDAQAAIEQMENNHNEKVAADTAKAEQDVKDAAERAAAAAKAKFESAISSIRGTLDQAIADIDASLDDVVEASLRTKVAPENAIQKVSTPKTVAKTQEELAKQNRILYLQNQLKDLNLSYARGEISKDAYNSQYQKISAELQGLNAPGVGGLVKSSTGSSSTSNATDGLSGAMEGLKQYSDVAFQVSDAISNLGSAYEENIRRQVEAGKLSAKEGKKRLKEEAAIQGSLALTAGLAASIYSMYSVWKDNKTDLWVKVAMSVATAASIVGQTISTVNSIKAAGSGLSSASASVASSAAPQITYVSNPNSNQDIVDAVNNTTQAVQTTQTVLVVDDYKKVADQANRVQVQSSF